MVQNFREILENPMIENFCDKNFMIATFFGIGGMHAANRVAPPTICMWHCTSILARILCEEKEMI